MKTWYNECMNTNNKQVTIRIDKIQHKKLDKVREEIGVSVANSVRKAVNEYLKKLQTIYPNLVFEDDETPEQESAQEVEYERDEDGNIWAE